MFDPDGVADYLWANISINLLSLWDKNIAFYRTVIGSFKVVIATAHDETRDTNDEMLR